MGRYHRPHVPINRKEEIMIDTGLVVYRVLYETPTPIDYIIGEDAYYGVNIEKYLRSNGHILPFEEVKDVEVSLENGVVEIEVDVVDTYSYKHTFYYIKPAKMFFKP